MFYGWEAFQPKYHRDKIEQLLDSNDVGGLGDKSHIAGRELGVGQTWCRA